MIALNINIMYIKEKIFVQWKKNVIMPALDMTIYLLIQVFVQIVMNKAKMFTQY